jgi:cytochrome c oxidase subunit IV
MTHTHHHIASIRMYVAVFLTLIAGTALTVTIARMDLGRLNVVVALTIAVIKATLVVLFFMHLRWSGSLVKIVIGAALLWLLILLVLMGADYATRGWIPVTLGW